ncbi:MAG: hypothetical protein HYU66_02935 [Armatimonadetes bacterium]|nr:hypothetical protein [Armatimonadota bacterium]
MDEVVEELVARGRLDSALIAGEEPVVDRVAQVEPRLLRCLLGEAAAAPDYPERALDRGCLNLQPWFTNVSPELVVRAHGLGLTVHPFFADDEARMRLWMGYGVDGILTNEPALMQRVVASG